ncbi:hypothetical protein [Bartonella tamiae]|uniref:Uncharacterized protein n=1 Tax=Bartonella tamiae Th239 TaxID=1094558 RepID=J0QT27_9HYPH|nr:hypothetical protein [Bartonella tamiae]EJF89021.1 hypothetical protein ME5_01572 [Bartonella tamiae Th239]EJF94729.1 hypothetical protein MEG_00310 [Bartonella tamiae Th307]
MPLSHQRLKNENMALLSSYILLGGFLLWLTSSFIPQINLLSHRETYREKTLHHKSFEEKNVDKIDRFAQQENRQKKLHILSFDKRSLHSQHSVEHIFFKYTFIAFPINYDSILAFTLFKVIKKSQHDIKAVQRAPPLTTNPLL